MKALTICQPYAELIATGEKLVENRTWSTAYRGPLLIHAGKSRKWLDGEDPRRFTFGAFVAVAQLVACLPIDAASWGHWEHLRTHSHAFGPVCWVLEDVRRLNEPIASGGALGLWIPAPAVIAVAALKSVEPGVGETSRQRNGETQ